MVDVYGDSYGTYFAQAFAVRHPERVRAVVLDAAYAVEGFDPWAREESVDAPLTRGPRCAGAPRLMAASTRWPSCAAGRCGSTRSRSWPPSRDADGGRQRIRLDGAALGQMAGDGSYYYTIYRDLLAALRAYERGDRAPLLRLAAEDLPVHRRRPREELLRGRLRRGGLPRLPDPLGPGGAHSPPAARSSPRARALIDPADFAPFPKDIWLRSLYIDQLVTGCLRWPAQAVPRPARPARRRATRACRCSCSTATWT